MTHEEFNKIYPTLKNLRDDEIYDDIIMLRLLKKQVIQLMYINMNTWIVINVDENKPESFYFILKIRPYAIIS